MLIFAHIRANFMDAFIPRLSEWFPAGVLFVLGIAFSFNPTLMDNPTTRGYSLMLSIASQSTWSIIMIICGALRLLILIVNGAWRKSPWARAGSALIFCFFWTAIIISFSTSMGFAFIGYLGWLAMDFTNIIRAMRDARIVDNALAREKKNAGE